jgi:hypothetical protein
MSAERDPELGAWSEAWRETSGPGLEARLELGARVRRGGRRLWALAVLEGVFAVAFLGLALAVAAHDPSPPALVWAAGVWAFTLVAWRFSLQGRRSLWQPPVGGARGFVELTRARLRHKLAAARFAGRLLAAEIAFVSAWGAWKYFADPLQFAADLSHYVLVYGLTALLSAAIVGWVVDTRRRTRRELEALEEMAAALE